MTKSASGAKTTNTRGGRGGRGGGRGGARGRGGGGRGGQYGGGSTSPGEQHAVEKAAVKYQKKKSSKGKREQAKELVGALIPQTVEMSIQPQL